MLNNGPLPTLDRVTPLAAVLPVAGFPGNTRSCRGENRPAARHHISR